MDLVDGRKDKARRREVVKERRTRAGLVGESSPPHPREAISWRYLITAARRCNATARIYLIKGCRAESAAIERNARRIPEFEFPRKTSSVRDVLKAQEEASEKLVAIDLRPSFGRLCVFSREPFCIPSARPRFFFLRL